MLIPLPPVPSAGLLHLIDGMSEPILFSRINDYIGMAEDGSRVARMMVVTIYNERCFHDCDCLDELCEHLMLELQRTDLLPRDCQRLILEFLFPEEYGDRPKPRFDIIEMAAMTRQARVDRMALRQARGEDLWSDDLAAQNAIFEQFDLRPGKRSRNGTDGPEVLVARK